jgi:hypothetical protein
MRKRQITLLVLASVVLTCLIGHQAFAQSTNGSTDLTGAWTSNVQLTSGAYAEIKDLTFKMVFNAGGTMTESSNYDAAPPASPAYGVWRRIGGRKFEAKYEFFQPQAVAASEEIFRNNGWLPGGYGILRETITLSRDGNSFESTITIDMFDNSGKAISGGGKGTARGVRIRF